MTTAPAKNLKFIDLFAGIGGLRLAFENSGGECVFSSEWDKDAQITYLKNFYGTPVGDITQIKDTDIPAHDILIAGFPCQPFSVAGHRKGFNDTRGTLFFDIARIIKYHRPSAFLLENVKGLVTHDNKRTLMRILEILRAELNYTVDWKVMNTMSYANIPQNRERLVIVGFNNDYNIDASRFTFPKTVELTKRIADIIDKTKQPDKYYYTIKSRIYEKLAESVVKKDTVYQWRRKYVRENKASVSPTLTANMGTGGHNVPIILDDYGIRKLTPRECLRFQGFPEWYIMPDISDTKLYKQAGNSVTIPLMQKVALEIVNVLNWRGKVMGGLDVSYAWAMPSAQTFTIKPINDLLKGLVNFDTSCDPFCGSSTFCKYQNDLKDTKVCALDYMKSLDSEMFDCVLLDPPYSNRQISEHYKAAGKEVTGWHTSSGFTAALRKEAARITKHLGIVITFGWNSTGIPASMGGVKKRILIVGHGGNHNDTIVTVCEIRKGL